uniref:Uncharacterized protein n=1 Tax=Anguilla anguilla TaxID=7936 RepID=A0A0E9PAH7_ANGAN
MTSTTNAGLKNPQEKVLQRNLSKSVLMNVSFPSPSDSPYEQQVPCRLR